MLTVNEFSQRCTGARTCGSVDQIFPRWNPLTSWMRQIEDFQRAA